MLKRVINLSLLGLLVVSIIPASAQSQKSAFNSTADTGTQGGYGHSSWRGTETPFDYQQQAAPGQAPLAPQGWADITNTQGASSPNGPLLYGTPSYAAGPGGDSGAVSSAPYQGTYTAPGNLALMQMRRSTLPPTRLSSFVRDSGMNDAIYGDEGACGLPPYFGFHDGHRIERGLSGSGGLTTGHRSDAPSAWGYPQ